MTRLTPPVWRLRDIPALMADRLRDNLTMVLNSGSLVGTQLVTSALGFLYWGVAARFYPEDSVGLSSAAVSAMLLLGNVGMLGLGTLLVGELPRRESGRAGIITAASLAAGAAGTVLGLMFGLVSPWVAGDLEILVRDPLSLGLFAVGVGLSSAGFVLDQGAIGLLRGDVQLWRNGLHALLKLLILLGVGFWGVWSGGLAIYSTWALATAISLAVPLTAFLRAGHRWSAARPNWPALRSQGRTAVDHHALNLALMGPGLMLPVLVTAILSARVNAYFYVAWMIGSFLFVVPSALTTVLYAVSAADPRALAARLRMTLGLSLGFGVLACAGVILFGNLVLSAFGPAYAVQAGWGLLILALSVFPITIRGHFVALVRIRQRIGSATRLLVLGGLLELAGAATGAILGGLTGLFLGWFAAVSTESLLMLGSVWVAIQVRARPGDRSTASTGGADQ